MTEPVAPLRVEGGVNVTTWVLDRRLTTDDVSIFLAHAYDQTGRRPFMAIFSRRDWERLDWKGNGIDWGADETCATSWSSDIPNGFVVASCEPKAKA